MIEKQNKQLQANLYEAKENVNTPLNRRTLSDQVYEYLINALIMDELKQGQRINEVEIAKSLHVSPTPVREALNKLKGDGIVLNDPWQGSYVRSLNLEDIKQLFELRFALERLGLESAIPLLNDKDLTELLSIERKYEIAYSSLDRLLAAQANIEFHKFFANRANNKWLVSMINNLDNLIHLVRAPLTRISTGEQSVYEHCKVVAAVKDHDTDSAVEALRSHIMRVYKDSLLLLKAE